MTSHSEATALLVAMEYLDGCEPTSRARFVQFLSAKYSTGAGPPMPQAAPRGQPMQVPVSEEVAKAVAANTGKPIQRMPPRTLAHPAGFQQAELQRDLPTPPPAP